jgi:hypothetical protein
MVNKSQYANTPLRFVSNYQRESEMNFFGGDNAANNANILAAAKIEFDTFAEMYGK